MEKNDSCRNKMGVVGAVILDDCCDDDDDDDGDGDGDGDDDGDDGDDNGGEGRRRLTMVSCSGVVTSIRF